MRILVKNAILNGKNQDLLIDGKKISRIGKNLNLKADEKIEAKGEKLVIPGLINCHTHSPMIFFRGIGEDLPLKDWLEKEIWPREQKLTEEAVYWGTKLACLEMIKNGITTFNEMYWFEEAQIAAIKEMGIRGIVGLVLLDFLPMGKKEKVEKILSKYSDFLNPQSLIKFSLAPHAIYTVSAENLKWAKKIADKFDLSIHMHLAETKEEISYSKKIYKKTPVEFLEKIGFLNNRCIFAHAIWLSEKEIKILEKRGCHLVYNPCSNMKLASGIFPWLKIKNTKINVCLGTDGPASNNSLNLFKEMKNAVLLQKVVYQNPTIITAKEVFFMATKNGSKALRINSGSIKEGRLADLVFLDLNKVEMMPNFDTISHLVYGDADKCVTDVICNGKFLMREGKIHNEEKIKKEFKKLWHSLKL